MFTQDRLVASALAWLVVAGLAITASPAAAQSLDFGAEEEDGEAEVPLPDEVPMEEEEDAEAEEGPAESQAYAFAVADAEDLQLVARELNGALRDVVAADPRFTISEADARLHGLTPEAAEALDQARELFQNARRAYDNLELDQAYELFEQALQAYEDQVAHVGDLNLFTNCLLYMGASEALRGRRRQAVSVFTQMLIIDPERRPDPNVFPPQVVETFEYAQGRLDRIREGTLEVTSEPAGADLYVDGVFQGQTPQTLPNLKSGQHYVRVRRQGYVEAGQVVDVGSRRPTGVELTLEPTRDGARVADLVAELPAQLSDRPSQAEETVQRLGEILGIEILMIAVVFHGDDGVRVQFIVWDTLEGESLSRQVAGPYEADPFIIAGEAPQEGQEALTAAWAALNVPQVEDVPMPPPEPEPEPEPESPRPWWQQWWFWTAVGAVVVGAGLGIGFGVAAASEDSGPTNGEVILDL